MKIKTDILSLAGYVLLTVIFTYPVAFSSNEVFPGDGGDGYWYAWNLWWVKKALLTMSNPHYATGIFYPLGVSIAPEIQPFNAAVSIPFQIIFGLVATYKMIWLMSFILSGYGAFLLIRYLTKDAHAAFVSGIIFSFCPYHFAHALGHMNLINIQWIPLYVMFMIKVTEEKNRINSLLAAIFLFLAASASYYYLIHLITFTLFYFLYYVSQHEYKIKRDVLKRVAVSFLLFGLLIAPYIYPIIRDLIVTKSDYMYAGGFTVFSADLVGFFIPTVFHPIFKDYIRSSMPMFVDNAAEYTIFAGYSVILLSLIAFFRQKIKRVRFWSLSALIFFILSLGPLLRLNGLFKILIGDTNFYIPLPYIFLVNLPIFSMARVPSRWNVLVMLSLAVLSGYGLKYLFKEFTDKKRAIFLFAIIAVLFEFLAIPYPMATAEVPSFYRQIASDGGDYAILDIPSYTPTMTYPIFMYYQTVHEKRLTSGYVSRTPENVATFISSTPFISNLAYWSGSKPYEDILYQNLTGVGRSILNYYNIKYVVLHTDKMTKGEQEYAKNLLKSALNATPATYENDSMIVYEVNREPIVQFMSRGGVWYGLEELNGSIVSWMPSNAEFLIYSEKSQTLVLRSTLRSFFVPRTLEIHSDLTDKSSYVIPSDDFTTIDTQIKVIEGMNIVKLDVKEGCQTPYNVLTESNDKRCLSLAFQNVSIINMD